MIFLKAGVLMYIIKNALLSISRSKGRNILIGIIALVIAVSACVALSIKESAVKAREDTLNQLSVTAQISFDIDKKLQNSKDEIDPNSNERPLLNMGSLTMDEYEIYASAESVKDTYYSLSVTLDATGDVEPIDTMGTFDKDNSGVGSDRDDFPVRPDGGREFVGMMGTQGDFNVVGYSSYEAMGDVISGINTDDGGRVFAENTTENECIISQELATYNNLAVGDEIVLANPNNTEETFTFKIVGLYTSESENSSNGAAGYSTAADNTNQIYTSYESLKTICDISSESAEEVTDEETGMTTTTAVQSNLSYTYVFANKEDYEAFDAQARTLGLSEDYSIVSGDLEQYENAVVQLENLSQTSGKYLVVVFVIGAIVLIVINIFNIRERKYEIGVLTAIGMKKWKVASQFVTELFVITLAAIIVGAGIGAVASVPMTKTLLSAQIEANQKKQSNMSQTYGEDYAQDFGGMTGIPGGPGGSFNKDDLPEDIGGFGGFMNNVKTDTETYMNMVSYSTDLTVIVQLIGVGILLTIVSSLAAVLFIMRYEPLKILTNRD